MNFDVTVNGRPWRVAIEPADAQGRQISVITIRGRRRTYDAAWVDAGTLSLIPLDGRAGVREFTVEPGETGALLIATAGTRFDATVVSDGTSNPRLPHRVERAAEPMQGRQSVVATMPGRIMRVLVATGDRVTAGQPVVVVEAMKMENEMRAPKDGVVQEISVKEGAVIDAGAVLLVIA